EYRLHEHVGGPRTGRRTEATIEVERWPRRLYLLERHSLLLQVGNAIANHHQHVPIRRQVGRVRQPSAARNDPRATLRPILGDCQIEDVIQPVDHTLNGPAPVELDHGITDRRKEIAGADDLRMTEE